MELDLQFLEGKHAGKTALAIYAWDGENLKVCGVRPDEVPRPTDFTTAPDDNRVLVVFRRQNP